MKKQEKDNYLTISEFSRISDILGMKLQKLEEGVSARVDGLIFIQSVSRIMFLLAIRKDIS